MRSSAPGEADVGQPDLDSYRELFELSADAILIIEGGTFVDCNAATVQMLRCATKQDVLHKHPSELSPPRQPDGRESFEKANAMMDLALSKGSHRFEWEYVRADGEVFPVEVLLTAAPAKNKPVLHVVWRDITERRLMEDQLRQAQKMEAIGKLAGGIAHDFNNLLVAIIGQSELLEDEFQDQPEHLEGIAEIRQAGLRAASLVRQLLLFSRKQELLVEHLDLDAVLSDMTPLLRRLIGEGVHLQVVLPDRVVPIKSDRSQLEQVVLNLATNAQDAMPEGGQLRINLDVEEVVATTKGVGNALAAGRYATLTVSDTGKGMDEKTRLRAFEPFFTTKRAGEGTGLGLASVYGIVEHGGGTVTLESTAGGGTVARVYLPVSRQGALRLVTTSDLPTAGGSETILVVEDEVAVSSLELEVLERSGYKVMLAPDGVAALELWQEHQGEIDLVVTDVVMPRMGGARLAQELYRQGYTPKVLFSSGYTNSAIEHLSSLGVPVDLLEKPFSTAELIGRVRLALDRAGPALLDDQTTERYPA